LYHQLHCVVSLRSWIAFGVVDVYRRPFDLLRKLYRLNRSITHTTIAAKPIATFRLKTWSISTTVSTIYANQSDARPIPLWNGSLGMVKTSQWMTVRAGAYPIVSAKISM
jgi:hypothetical protein